MVSGGFAVVSVLYIAFVVALAVLTVALIVLVFAAIRVLRLSATERQLRIERLRYDAVVDGIEDGGAGPDETGPTTPTV
jgi:putative exporter of polyketide antibiotics